MQRRAFIAASTAALASSHALPASGSSGDAQTSSARLLLLEIRRYRLRTGAMATRFGAHVTEALVPALNRAGCAPIGAWHVTLGPDSPTLHLLVPHPAAESLATLDERLEADGEYHKAAAAIRGLPSGDPPFLRCDSSLHRTVASMPGIDATAAAAAGPARVFELRTYRSHSDAASRRKVEMFEAGGELRIFRRLGLTTVFFSHDLVGEGLPSLTYMLVFADPAARERAWSAFRQDPEWLKLRARPEYTDAEIVSGISSLLLRPAEGSQL